MEKTLITQNQIVNQILHIGHGNLDIYTDPCLKAVDAEPELFAHLIAYNHKKGEIRDSKTALPIIALYGKRDMEFYENAAAHLCLLDTKNLVRAQRYQKSLGPVYEGGLQWLKEAITLYIRKRERQKAWWDRTALQHRKSFKTLYAMNHIKPSDRANRILFKRNYPKGSVFAKLCQLKNMKPDEAAGTILNYKIPFLIAVGALGGIKDKTDIILALIESMSKAELINNTATLKRWGAMENAALKAAYDKGLLSVKKDTVSTLKAGQAAKAVGDKKLAKKLERVQEEQIDKKGGIDGDWLILGDRSGSMHQSIEIARHVASILARQVKGQVHLVFFNERPVYFNVTNKSFEQIKKDTSRVHASGGTSVGCGLDMIRDKNLLVNGIAICSDGGDNTAPLFHETYKKYCAKMGIDPAVYLYHVPGDPNDLSIYCQDAGIQLEQFKIGRDVDYYSLPQLALTMRTSRYALIEEILETKLLKFEDVFK
jgi:hypothetical protein